MLPRNAVSGASVVAANACNLRYNYVTRPRLGESDARGLHLPIQHLDRSLLFGLEFGCLLIAKLGVDEAIKRLRRAHPVQLVHGRRVNGVWLARCGCEWRSGSTAGHPSRKGR